MTESCDSSENVNIIFTVRDDDVMVIFHDEFHNIGYLDISEDEKTLLETSNFNFGMTIDPLILVWKNPAFADNSRICWFGKKLSQ